jgi:hypothetical protein
MVYSLEGAGAAEKPEDPLDPAELGTVVRALAFQAHTIRRRSTTGKSADLHVIHEQLDRLQVRLDQLRRSHALRFDELQRWLGRLSQEIKDRDRECSG